MRKVDILRFIVDSAEGGRRIDAIVASRVPGLGRKAAAQLATQGRVRAAGRRVKKSWLVQPGEEVVVELVLSGRAKPAEEIPLVVILESDDIVVVEKPAGIPTTALPGREEGTLAGALLARFPEMAQVGSPREPGVAHRLDVYTSGLVVAARKQTVLDRLREAMSHELVDKRYLAVVAGPLEHESGRIEGWLGPDPRDRRRVCRAEPGEPGTRHCRTEFELLRTASEGSEVRCLLEVRVHAAYRHQIRAHLAALGHPLLGDPLYGGPDVGIAPRHALHASYIAAEAAGVPKFEAISSLPPDLSALLEGWRGNDDVPPGS